MAYDIPPWTPDPDYWKVNGPENVNDDEANEERFSTEDVFGLED